MTYDRVIVQPKIFFFAYTRHQNQTIDLLTLLLLIHLHIITPWGNFPFVLGSLYKRLQIFLRIIIFLKSTLHASNFYQLLKITLLHISVVYYILIMLIMAFSLPISTLKTFWKTKTCPKCWFFRMLKTLPKCQCALESNRPFYLLFTFVYFQPLENYVTIY